MKDINKEVDEMRQRLASLSGTMSGKEAGLMYAEAMALNWYIVNSKANARVINGEKAVNMISATVKDNGEMRVFNYYITLLNNLNTLFNLATVRLAEFSQGFYRLLGILDGIREKEVLARAVLNEPFYIDESDYLEIKIGMREGYLNFDDINFEISYADAIFQLFKHYSILAASGDPIPKSIAEALKEEETEKVSNKRIISALLKTSFINGYYTLPDGTRSDQASEEEWKEKSAKIEGEVFKKFLASANIEPAFKDSLTEVARQEGYTSAQKEAYRHETARLFFYGAEEIKKAYYLKFNEQLEGSDKAITDYYRALVVSEKGQFYDFESKLNSEQQYKIMRMLKPSAPLVEWRMYDELPRKVNKLTALYEALYFYNNKTPDGTTERRRFKEFREDYPKLYAALRNKLIELAPQVEELKEQQFYKPFVSAKDALAIKELSAAFVEFESTIVKLAASAAFEEHSERIQKNGIAVTLQDNTPIFEQVKELDAAKELERAEEKEKEIGVIQQLERRYCLNSLAEIMSINEIIEKAGEISEAKELAECTLNSFKLGMQLLFINYQAFFTYMVMYKTSKERADRFKRLFPIMNVSSAVPSPKVSAAVEQIVMKGAPTVEEAEEAARQLSKIIEIVVIGKA